MNNNTILKFEFKHCLESKKFKIIILFCTILSIGAFLVNSFYYYGGKLTEIRSATDVNIINGTKCGAIRMILILILPLISLSFYSDSFLVDYNTGMYKNIVSRISKDKYIFNKVVVISTISFATILYMFVLNELLCIIAFPINGIANSFGNPSFKKSYISDSFLALIKLNNPYMYDFIMIFIYSIISSLHAILSFSISLFFKHKRVVFMIGYFLVCQAIDMLFQVLGIYEFHIDNIINSNNGSLIVLAIWSIVILTLSFVLINVNKNSKEFLL